MMKRKSSITYLLLSLAFKLSATVPNSDWDCALDEEDDSNIHELAYEKFAPFYKQGSFNRDNIILDWPVKDDFPALLTRFGTPTVIKIQNLSLNILYSHEAIDITRSNISISDSVFSPVEGIATLIKEEGEDSDYSTAVVILDIESNAIISLLHIKPANHLREGEFINVKKGDYVGNLALVISNDDPIKQEAFKHTHLALIDPEKYRLINPNTYFDQYKDSKPPSITDIILFDDKGKKINELKYGKIDLVVTGFDKDDFNDMNFEVRKISANVTDQNQNVLFNLSSCNIDFLTSQINTKEPITDAFYMDFIGSFVNKDFSNFLTNASAKDREFSYVLTNFSSTEESCHLLKDETGYFIVNESVEWISINATFTDDFGNSHTKSKKYYR